MSKLKFMIVLLLAAFIVAEVPEVRSQTGDQAFRMKLESILHQFKNYRFSNISVYKIKPSGLSSIRGAIQEKREQESLGATGDDATGDAALADVPQAVQNIIENQVSTGEAKSSIRREIDNRGYKVPENFDAVYQAIFNKVMNLGNVKTIRDIYVITTQMGSQEIAPNTIIAMMVTYEGSMDLEENMDRLGSDDIFTYPELVEFDLTTLTKNTYRADNMYQLLQTAFIQENVQDVTLEARGIGTLLSFAAPEPGQSKSLIYNEDRINEYDIQAFMRISQGQPLSMYKENELIVSPDLVSWKKYEYFKNEDGSIDSLYPTNVRLPQVGLELKYGIEGINYPSFWSERITASAIWENVKLGIILPTSGYSSISQDAFDVQQTMTHGGFGIAGQMDFPVAIIPQSGIFHVNFGYVFGDANRSDHNPANNNVFTDPNFFTEQLYTNGTLNPDYMVRFNAQLHYTFGIAIDEDYQMRFGLGGTGYQMESWQNVLSEDGTAVNFEKADEEFVGGISGEVEFMRLNNATPWGIGMQYFNEAVYANIWLQIPIVENTFSIRLDANGFFKAFADEAQPWEHDSVFFPMARFIFNF